MLAGEAAETTDIHALSKLADHAKFLLTLNRDLLVLGHRRVATVATRDNTGKGDDTMKTAARKQATYALVYQAPGGGCDYRFTFRVMGDGSVRVYCVIRDRVLANGQTITHTMVKSVEDARKYYRNCLKVGFRPE